MNNNEFNALVLGYGIMRSMGEALIPYTFQLNNIHNRIDTIEIWYSTNEEGVRKRKLETEKEQTLMNAHPGLGTSCNSINNICSMMV